MILYALYWNSKNQFNSIGKEKENNVDGTISEKLILGEYQWMSYQDVSQSSKYFGFALRFHLGQQPKTLITVFAETRAEWMISCLGAFSQVIQKV